MGGKREKEVLGSERERQKLGDGSLGGVRQVH